MLRTRQRKFVRCSTAGCTGDSRTAGLCKTCYTRTRVKLDRTAWAAVMRQRQIDAAARREHEAKLAAQDAARADRSFAKDPRVKAFRTERAKKAKRDAVIVADAKRAYDKFFEEKATVGRGGRPRGQGILVGNDPADALIHALERTGR